MCVELKKDNKIKDNGVWVKLEDGARIDGYIRDGDNIYECYVDSATNDYKSFEPLKKVDVNSFEVCVGTGYARDKKHVFFPLKITCIDAYSFGGCYFEEYIIKGANPKRFKILENGCAVDRGDLYLEGKKSVRL